MLSAPKLCQSLSMSGPSATANPIAPKIAMISSVVRLTGWIDPTSPAAGGSVTSSRSAASLAASSALSSTARRASMDAANSSRSAFSAAPRARRSSGASLPSSLSSPVSAPDFPSHPHPHRIERAEIARGRDGLRGAKKQVGGRDHSCDALTQKRPGALPLDPAKGSRP